MNRQDKIQAMMDVFLQMKRSVHRQLMAADACSATPVQTEILALVSGGTDRVADIAQAIQATPSAVTQQVNQLVETGLIAKTDSAADRRQQHLSVTTVGHNVLATKRRLMHARLEHIVDVLTDEELDQFIAISKKIAQTEKQ